MRIIPREEWGAKPTRGQLEPLKTPVKNIIIFPETDTQICHSKDQCSEMCREVQERHFAKNRPDIMFNFLIGFDGNVYEGTGWNKHGTKIRAHPELTGNLITIAHIGDFEDWLPPWGMEKALEELIKYGIENNYIDPKHRRGDIIWGTEHYDPVRFHDKCIPNRGVEDKKQTNQNQPVTLGVVKKQQSTGNKQTNKVAQIQ